VDGTQNANGEYLLLFRKGGSFTRSHDGLSDLATKSESKVEESSKGRGETL
jgi:hypothetical protein